MADVGRPTDYKPEYCQAIIEYFSIEPYREVEREVVTKSGQVATIHVTEATDFPSFAGFAAKIGHHRETLRNWCENEPEFFAAYKKAKELQENWLVTNGLKRLIDTAFGIFIAKNVTDMHDKQHLEHSGKTEKTVKLDWSGFRRQLQGDVE